MADTPSLPHAETTTRVVILPAEIDMTNADQVGADLDAAFGPGIGIVIADMSGTRFCDTSGIHALVLTHQRAKADNTGFRVETLGQLAAGGGQGRREGDGGGQHGIV